MKILILSSARSGSNYLRNIIYMHSIKNTVLINEPFEEGKYSTGKKKEKYLTSVVKTCLRRKNVVCKSHLDQIYEINDQRYINFFLNNELWYTIFLLRKNLFKCSFSFIVAEYLENFNNKNYEKVDVLIDEDRFLEVLEKKILYWIKFSELKKLNNYRKIIYFEDLTFNPGFDYKKLNLPLKSIPQNEVYINEKTPYDIINVLNLANLQEVFNKRMATFFYDGINNNNGMLELK